MSKNNKTSTVYILPTYYLFLSFLIALKAKIGYVILSTYNMQILSRYVMKIREERKGEEKENPGEIC